VFVPRIPLPLFAWMTLCLLCACQANAQGQPSLSLMPLPSSYEFGTGHLTIDPSFTVALSGYREARLDRAVDRFLRNLARQTGLPLNVKYARTGDASKATLAIHTSHASKAIQEPGEDESYVLEVTTSGAQLAAANPLGILHGLETFLQLVAITPGGFAAPAITIQDRPRFPWRGLMIDAARHFIPIDVLKRNLDGMSAVKMNVFHWHLSDNQGFRVESKRFPRLQGFGSDGLYYTRDEIRDLIAYARDRGIRVVPEFDMPGHSTAWFAGYPELASGPGPYEIERRWGVFDPAMDPTRESTYQFLDAFIAEMAQLFPDRYFHIGGDAVNGKQWDANPRMREFIRLHDLKDDQGLQAYFNKRIQRIVTRRGKIMIGWDEILHPDVPKNVLVQSWRGQQSLATAAQAGHRGILSSGYYLDLIWPAERHYAVDPMTGAAANLGPQEQARILGGEACMWAEHVSPETMDSRIWPRNAAIAERLWSPAEVRDPASMYARLEEISRRLDWLGLTHNSNYVPMLERLTGSGNIAPLRTLADVVEPVQGYQRSALATTEPTSATPLNRLIDAARPESMAARRFAEQVDQFLAGQHREEDSAARLRAQLALWRDNDSKLQPLIGRSFLLEEVAPLSQNLSTLGAAGLAALDFIARGEKPSEEWKAQQAAVIEEARKPKAQLLLTVAPAVTKLVEAASFQKPSPE